ncbi:MAG: hypothetical protein NTZ03_12265 [Actinobacteria bacterium]|nr:hypothetical protein [Actinomycetota bacterium]
MVRVHVLQIAYDDYEAPDVRLSRVERLLADQSGADLVVLPELWFNGGFAYAGWRETAQPLDGELVGRMQEAARSIGSTLHMGSLVEFAGCQPDGTPVLYNTSVLIDSDGAVLGSYRKIHRFGFSEGEPQLLEPGDDVTVIRAQIGGVSTVVGLATCYDLRFPELFRGLVGGGAELILVPSAWPMSRVEHWVVLGKARAIENQSFMVLCNTAGEHAGLQMGGLSCVIDPGGQSLVVAGPDSEVLVVDIDLSQVSIVREAFPVLADSRLL